MHNQICFTSTAHCDAFEINVMRLNLSKGAFTCFNCSCELFEHRPDAVTEEDVGVFLAHRSAKDGASCIFQSGEVEGRHGALYLGGLFASVDPFVSKYSIQVVINCSDLHLSQRTDFVSWGKRVLELEMEGVITVLRLGWSDSLDQMLWQFKPWDQIIDSVIAIDSALKNGKNVLIHCAQGKSRSAAVAIAYLLALETDMNVEKALRFVRSKRPIVDPNPNFMAQLAAFHLSPELKELKHSVFSK